MKVVMSGEIRTSYLYRCRYSKRKIFQILEDFRESDHSVAQLIWEPGEYANARSLQKVFGNAIRRYRMHDISVTVRQGKAYLIKEEQL